jgi:hypothetical protein
MFSARIGLFNNIPCPDISGCSRNPCLFSHERGLTRSAPIIGPLAVTSTSAPHAAMPAKSILKHAIASSSNVTVSTKRPITPTRADPSASPGISEPPRKLQRLDTLRRAVQPPSTSSVCLFSLSMCPYRPTRKNRSNSHSPFQKVCWSAHPHRQPCHERSVNQRPSDLFKEPLRCICVHVSRLFCSMSDRLIIPSLVVVYILHSTQSTLALPAKVHLPRRLMSTARLINRHTAKV